MYATSKTDYERFSSVRIDYGGPFFIKKNHRQNTKTFKVYLALFICMAIKAVRIKIVSDLTSDAFLAALTKSNKYYYKNH